MVKGSFNPKERVALVKTTFREEIGQILLKKGGPRFWLSK